THPFDQGAIVFRGWSSIARRRSSCQSNDASDCPLCSAAAWNSANRNEDYAEGVELASPGFPPQADTLGRGRQAFVNPERVAPIAHGHSPIVVAGSSTSAVLVEPFQGSRPYLRFVTAGYPGKAGEPWAGGFNAFGVQTNHPRTHPAAPSAPALAS